MGAELEISRKEKSRMMTKKIFLINTTTAEIIAFVLKDVTSWGSYKTRLF